jgi:hypothetical protein
MSPLLQQQIMTTTTQTEDSTMKTPQIKPEWEVGVWNGRTIITCTDPDKLPKGEQCEAPDAEPRCPQCGATSRWGVLGGSPHEEDCDFCKSVFG